MRCAPVRYRQGKGLSTGYSNLMGLRATGMRNWKIPKGTGTIEYAYYRMATDAGITMSPCRLYEENGRRYFMTRRVDRHDNGEKIHQQSLCALAHYDFNMAGAYSHEQALRVIRQLGLPMRGVEEPFGRMAFNVIARNQDDHVKNIAFLTDGTGRWSLSTAFGMTYSFNASGQWTASHQMTVNAKRDNFTIQDFKACARAASMKRGRAETLVNENAPAFAVQIMVPNTTIT